ncbi:hypothetical protein [Algoriphagus halophytocola]|uniref:Uncharacterized protein n=1 Tax=Algoriphagus halophytocola TaxID=2991499 RepID=A0ABY6MEG2_9BACT|nr:hypothetical protein [Algoriphagus sp. TR-M5]UZD21799.1 hypothetical protein OM944_14120 [Algoriphagus sp. TR-M5]
MTSSEFRDMILKKEPKFSVSLEYLFEKLANKQGKGEFSQFGPLYELYVYAFFIGLKIDSRIELASGSNAKKFVAISGWKSASPLIDFLLLTIFSRSEEIGFDWNKLEDMEEKELAEVVRKIITFIEEYAYGGLDYLKNKFDRGELDNSQYLFVDLLSELVLE